MTSSMCDGDPPLFDFDNNRTIAFIYALIEFRQIYSSAHRYLCSLICIVGTIANIIHILVLTQPAMRQYAVNCLLSAMALCDVATMLSYLIYIVRFNLFEKTDQIGGYSRVWIIFLLAHVVASIALHTISLYLSVAMAYIRWHALDRLNSRWLKPKITLYIFYTTVSAIILLSMPTLFVHSIEQLDLPNDYRQSSNVYTVSLSVLATDDSCRFFKFNLWLTGVIFKVLPCLLLFWFTIALMCKLSETNEKRRMLRPQIAGHPRSPGTHWRDRTTYMLVIMLCVFQFTELPQGILAILNAIYTTDVHTYIYLNVGDVLDLLSLVNCNVGFILYCCMSSRYRLTFRRLFLKQPKSCSSALLQINNQQQQYSNNNTLC